MPISGMCDCVIRVNIGAVRTDIWAGQPKSSLSAESCLWRYWSPQGEVHLYKLCSQNSNVPPIYDCETSVSFLVFCKGLNNYYLGQNLIPVLQQWTIMT